MSTEIALAHSTKFTDRQIAEIIANAGDWITIAGILQRLGLSVTDNHKRQVKGAVSRIVLDMRLPVASSKKPPYGYKLCVTAEDRQNGAMELALQAAEMFRRALVLNNKIEIRELLGQQGIPFKEAA